MYVLPPVLALLSFESRKYAIDSFVLGQGKEQFYLVYLFVTFSTVKKTINLSVSFKVLKYWLEMYANCSTLLQKTAKVVLK